MRILFVSHYATPHIGGIESVIHWLRRELKSRGHEVVHVACSASHYPLDELPPDEGVIRVPALNVLENRLGVPYPIFSPKLHTVLARELKRADVVHAHGLLYQSSFWALRYAKLRHRGPSGPVRVLTEHVGHVPYESGVLDRMESMAIGTIGRLSVKAAESVVVLNRQVGSEVEALGPNGPVLQIPNGIDTSLFRPAQNGEREALRREFGWDDLPRNPVRRAPGGQEGSRHRAGRRRRGARQVRAGRGGTRSAPARVGPRREGARPARVGARGSALPRRGRPAPALARRGLPRHRPGGHGQRPPGGDDQRPLVRPLPRGRGQRRAPVPPAPAAIARTLEALVGDSEVRADAAQAVLEHARSAFTWEQAALRHERLYENLLAARQLPGESLQLAPADAKAVAAQATTASERGAMP